jgi:glycogen phosphorylase
MNVVSFTVKPRIPEPLKPLEELAHNLWISWNFDAVMLFIRLDYDAWIASNQNPARLLGMVPQSRYEELATDDSYLSALNAVNERFHKYKEGETWYKGDTKHTIAYFSMEYGLDVSLPIYSGGLGVLSGDHIKTSSDLGLPLVGVGLLYRQGYFRQYLNADGYQQESYPENDWYNMPVSICKDTEGNPVVIHMNIGDLPVAAQVWEVKVGRISLYLLDTNIDENNPKTRTITATLYGGDRENRIRQEILLGIGGVKALRKLGINPAVTHMNEGHSAFLALERIRVLMEEEGVALSTAIQSVRGTNIFTTHTPVPAGNERFSIELMRKYFESITEGTGISWERFLAWGRENPADSGELFCMTVLAIKLSAYCNGVSELHGDITREMWKGIWPGLPKDEIPITSITNGIHTRTWESHNMLELLDRYFGPRFTDETTYLNIWDRMDRISDEELWRTHERRKERLVAFVRDRFKKQLKSRGVSANQHFTADEVLSPYTLTISFARRFATYKRATLLFRDPERLKKLLSDNEKPIQLIFSGKAHPNDIPGKQLIKDIVHFASQPEVRSKIVFLENYDISIAKYLVSGSDLWLNTPRRPLEASGTSGMKASINGVLNLSILDGWWAEAYDPSLGWAIGAGEEYSDDELQDEIESKALFDLLERDIIPMFYNRGRDRLPRQWIAKMKRAMTSVGKRFASHRMLMEYADKFYLPALENAEDLSGSNYRGASETAEYVEKLDSEWEKVSITNVNWNHTPEMKVGDEFTVHAEITLGNLSPQDVTVELYHGKLDSKGHFNEPRGTEMKAEGNASEGTYSYKVTMQCGFSGRQGYAVRIMPKESIIPTRKLPGYIVWR